MTLLRALPHPSRPTPTGVTVAIPARNEEARIGRLLRALAIAAARCPLPVRAVVLANNCTDRTCAVAGGFSNPDLPVELHQVSFPAGIASAGRARRLVMDLAAVDGALMFTTDADAAPRPGWINAALRSVCEGADLVCGVISARVNHVLATSSGARITKAEAAYGALVHEIRHYLDQLAGRQPLEGERPHYMESGASMAIRTDVYRAIGGLPPVDASEDRALVHRVEQHGYLVRYAPQMHAHVSARLRGRAQGGMAECLRQRMRDEDPHADQAMLPVSTLRALWDEAMSGALPAYPDRGQPCGSARRASDLERDLPELAEFVSRIVRPDFTRRMPAMRIVA